MIYDETSERLKGERREASFKDYDQNAQDWTGPQEIAAKNMANKYLILHEAFDYGHIGADEFLSIAREIDPLMGNWAQEKIKKGSKSENKQNKEKNND